MSSSVAPSSSIIRTQGLQFVRMLQGGIRLAGMYSAEHVRSQPLAQSALNALSNVLNEVNALTISFQFNFVVLNSLPVSDPSLSWLAGEFAKREIGFVSFSRGITLDNLVAAMGVLAVRAETVRQKGGLITFLQEHPLQHVQILAAKSQVDADGNLPVMVAAERVSAIGRALSVLEQLKGGGTQGSAGRQEAASTALNLTDEQRAMLPQLQELASRLARTEDASSLSDIAHRISEGGGEEMVQSLFAMALAATLEKGDGGQAQALLRSAVKQGTSAEALLQKIPDGESKRALAAYAAWLGSPLVERQARLADYPQPQEGGWLLDEAEESVGEGQWDNALDVLYSVFQAAPLKETPEWPALLARAQSLLAQACTGSLPAIAQPLLEVLSPRLSLITSAAAAAPLLGSVASLAAAAGEAQDFNLATTAAALLSQIASSESPLAAEAQQLQSNLLRPHTLSTLVVTYLDKKADADACQAIQKLLKRVGGQAAAELAAVLEKETNAPRRYRNLQLLKMLGKPAIPALAQKLAHSDASLVRDITAALGEMNDAAILNHLAPALRHPDERVQAAAVLAAQRTRSPDRAAVLARCLGDLKRTVLDNVLDDLVLLKEPAAAPFLEEFVMKHPQGVLFQHIEKALFALGASETAAAVQAVLRCASTPDLPFPYRQTAVRVLGRMQQKGAHQALKFFAKNEPDKQLREEASRLTLWDFD